MSTSGMSTSTRAKDLRGRAAQFARGRAATSGRPPRAAYEHYFIEDEGLHSRVHLQNFWSTFWPQIEAPAVAHVRAFDQNGTALGQIDRELGPFNSMFLEVSDLLAELGADSKEGTVAIDLEPPKQIRSQFTELPAPEMVEVKTPYWMAYYDGDENFMYVHSIEILHGETFGAPKMLTRAMDANVAIGDPWKSWRLLEVENLTELQLVVINHSPHARETKAAAFTANDATPLWEEKLEFAPRQLHRVEVPQDVLADWRGKVGEIPLVRVGLDPLLTGNGKPYVLLRYADGPLSLHHG